MNHSLYVDVEFEGGWWWKKICTSLDTGSAINAMNKETYNFLVKHEYPHIKEYFCPLLITDANGNTNFYTQCCRLDISFKLYPDTAQTHYIRNVRVFIIDDMNEMTLGVEFLKNFMMHSIKDGEQVLLDKNVPEDYLTKMDVMRFNWHKNDLGGRFYIPMNVNGKEENFFIDTGNGMGPACMALEDYKGDKEPEEMEVESNNSIKIIEQLYDKGTVEVNGINIDSEISYWGEGMNTTYSTNPSLLFKGKYNYSFDADNAVIYLRELE